MKHATVQRALDAIARGDTGDALDAISFMIAECAEDPDEYRRAAIAELLAEGLISEEDAKTL